MRLLRGIDAAWRALRAPAPNVRLADPPRPLLGGAFARRTWLPAGKRCAVVFTIDDVHPGKSVDGYDGGGDLNKGALRHVAWLLERHPELHVTLFVTPDWRQTSPFPTRTLLARVPVVRDRVALAPAHPKGTMSLVRHPDFVRYLRSMPRTDFAPHGLHHFARGPRIGTEFQTQSVDECTQILREAARIFDAAGLPRADGHQAPLWHVTPNLVSAAANLRMRWFAGGRDLFTPPSDSATAAMNGPRDASMMHPTLVANGRVVLFTTNFQATSDVERAFSILDQGGVLAIKAHIIKRVGSYVALDGIDEVYRAYLDALFRLIKERYAEDVWFTSMNKIAERVARTAQREDESASATPGHVGR